MLDVEYEDFIVRNSEVESGLDTVRKSVAVLYDFEYKTLKELYGSSNDDADVEEGAELPPYRTASTREVRPYLQPTAQDEFGFKGLDAPVG